MASMTAHRERDRSVAEPRAGERDAQAAAFEDELQPLLPRALRLAAAMRLDAAEAEDAVQEAALRAWDRRGNRRAGTRLGPWFLAIVANRCRERRRGPWSRIVSV